MFTSTGLFKDIPCPKASECSLINCIFSHAQSPTEDASTPNTEYVSISTIPEVAVRDDVGPAEPARKKRRVSESPPPPKSTHQSPRSHPRVTDDKAPEPVSNGIPSSVTASKAQKSARSQDHAPPIPTGGRVISPPPLNRSQPASRKPSKSSGTQQGSLRDQQPAKVKKESLLPRFLDHAPASHHIRMALLQQLHDAMATLNEKAAKDPDTAKTFILSKDELITMALDQEETTARTNPAIYTNVLKTSIMQLRKLSLPDWRKRLTETFKSKFMVAEANKEKVKHKDISTGLTPGQEVSILKYLRTPLKGLERFGYVTSPPTDAEIEAARQGVEAAGGFETCERCGSRFQVFPGRREEDGALTSGGSCTYHWAKLVRPPRQKTDAVTGGQQPYYPCCNESIGQSAGCTNSPHHVFKISEAKRLASIWQFECTPETTLLNTEGGSFKKPLAVAFDAEMGYTTKGLEIIRLTAVSWPQGDEVLDVLVRPLGEILDLNTRFSGITPSQMANAAPYGKEISKISKKTKPPDLEDGELSEEEEQLSSLRIVPDPQTARSLLFSLLDTTTPLIGHAIDNDLNVTRIIHPYIVDTVLLYPHPRGLPIRYGLKVLASKHLDRNIQKAGGGLGEGAVRGHDSKEDAIATGDLVRVKVGEKWASMKSQGWILKEGKLVPPTDVNVAAAGAAAAAASSLKRKHGGDANIAD